MVLRPLPTLAPNTVPLFFISPPPKTTPFFTLEHRVCMVYTANVPFKHWIGHADIRGVSAYGRFGGRAIDRQARPWVECRHHHPLHNRSAHFDVVCKFRVANLVRSQRPRRRIAVQDVVKHKGVRGSCVSALPFVVQITFSLCVARVCVRKRLRVCAHLLSRYSFFLSRVQIVTLIALPF